MRFREVLNIIDASKIFFVDTFGINNTQFNDTDKWLSVANEDNSYGFVCREFAKLGFKKHDSLTPDLKVFFIAMLEHKKSKFKNCSDVHFLREVNKYKRGIYSLWQWQKSRIIYHFDSDIENDLMENSNIKVTSKIPANVLNHIPHDHFFVATDRLNVYRDKFITFEVQRQMDSVQFENNLEVVGFFINKDDNLRLSNDKFYKSGKSILVSVLLTNSRGDLMIEGMYINLPEEGEEKTIEECIYLTESTEEERRIANLVAENIFPYLLYLCTENAMVRNRKVPKKVIKSFKSLDKVDLKDVYRPIDNEPSKRKFPPCEVINYISESKEKKDAPKSPHERRSHWHSYWIGKRNTKERQVILRWISAIMVNEGKGNVRTVGVEVR